MDNDETIGIILAGGIGSRMNLSEPKQYLNILGKEVLAYSIDAFKEANVFDDFIIVLNDDNTHRKRIEEKYGITTILGGATRNYSFKNALDYISVNHPTCDKIFVNESARPLLTPKIISDYLCLLNRYEYVYAASTVTDSLETIDGKYADRAQFRLVRSPEGYHFRSIYKYFNASSEITFPGHCLSSASTGYPYMNYVDNVKLTFVEDVIRIESLLKIKMKL